MGIKRYELNEAQWAKVAPLLPGKASDPGQTGSDNRLFVNGCLWVLRSGAHWCDLPERYGHWKTVHRRFSRWCDAGVWERVFDALTTDCLSLTVKATPFAGEGACRRVEANHAACWRHDPHAARDH